MGKIREEIGIMKKIRPAIAVMIVISFLLSSSVPSFAFGPNETRSVDNFFVEAQMLKGSGSGYGLDQTANRLQGIVVLIRIMGKETAAQNMANQPCQFTDVPEWARGYVNYAYAANISKGVSETKFGVNNKIDAAQYNTLMLRVLGYNDNNGDFSWEESIEKARQLSILSQTTAHEYIQSAFVYTKGDLLDTSFCYLEAKFKDQDETLLEQLISEGVITEELAKEYGLSVDGFDSITTNFSGDEYFSLSIEDEVMTVSGKSEDPDKAWLAVVVRDKNKDVERNTKYISRDSDGEYSVQVSTANLPSGEYYVNLYGNNEKYHTYHGIIYGELIFKVTARDAYFEAAPAYGKYLRISKGYRVEPEDTELSLITRADPAAIERITSLSADITQNCTSDYEKVLAIHDWVAENIYYDNDYINDKTDSTNETPVSVANSKYAVCVGYSTLTRDLLAAAGIPCKIAYGFAIGESGEEAWSDVNVAKIQENHAWNIAYVDGRWINIDTTWDSTNTYENGNFNRGDTTYHSYFDSTLEYFSGSHLEMELKPAGFDHLEISAYN
jgi:hypothetical protein